jgi:hypothetical protein
LIAAAIVVVDAVVYVSLIRAEGDSPARWFLALLAVSFGLLIYCAMPKSFLGPGALTVAGLLLVIGGLLGFFTTGAPLLVAGVTETMLAWLRLPAAR